MEVYHGSFTTVENPHIIKGRYAKDFGVGFYCTQLKKQAERWSGKYDTPRVNVYEYTMAEGLKVLEFKELTDEWLDFVVACRAGQPHCYDIVIGAMADDGRRQKDVPTVWAVLPRPWERLESGPFRMRHAKVYLNRLRAI